MFSGGAGALDADMVKKLAPEKGITKMFIIIAMYYSLILI
jgi:hypothetical protein